MKLEEILMGLYHVNFSTQRELAETFLRFSEHNESVEFKGKVFTLDEFKEWYTHNSINGRKTGRFTYYEDWDGFNMPSSALRPFYQGKFDPLSKMEENLLQAFKDKRNQRFYIIGTCGSRNFALLRHEIAHGLYFLSPEYRREVLEVIGLMSTGDRETIENFLRSRNYHPSVFEDEIQAYLLDRRCLGRNGIRGEGFAIAGRQIKKIFKKYREKYCKGVRSVEV